MIAKPMTYMNNSGQAAKLILSALGISPNQVLVIHDDIDLPLGKIKVKTKGGDAGRPDDQGDIVDYVLTSFTEAETQLLNEVIEEAIIKVEETLMEMNKRNNKTEENGEW